ncbi:glycosyltransferase family 2 protein [Lactiplantibacillus plantarum]|uniref:glycosyltransferase family 2 protein n=1 Tax=Lactiplantibacillus plantarum TaxID=1590 RepID=UPI002000CE7D|nr:glycosyltransferase family 2 protein [Lactiplantibacillus plantarum]MCK3677780.1 glycosyltransferase [Lactiplantibacillus plantarum]
MQESVSIIVPVYNVERYLRQCLTSIKNQTYKNLEIILVNDGSTDNSKIICEQFCQQDSRFNLISGSNAGLSNARNLGLERAHGDYVYFVDSDDWLDRNLIFEAIGLFNRFKVDVVAFSYYEVLGAQTMQAEYTNPELGLIDSDEALFHLFRGSFGNYVWKFIARRNVYIKNSIIFPKGRRFEDVATTYKIFGAASYIYFSSKPLYYYRQISTSITHVPASKDVDDMLVTVGEMDDYINNNFESLIPSLRSLEFNLLFMLLIRMNGWNTLSTPKKLSKLNLAQRNTMCALDKLHHYQDKRSREYIRQEIKLRALKYHLFSLILHVKKYLASFKRRLNP